MKTTHKDPSKFKKSFGSFLRLSVFLFCLTLLSANIFFHSDAQTRPDTIAPAALQQIQALIQEKESRTLAQQKLDSQLIYAIKLRRGETIATGVTTLEVNVAVDATGHAIVDITAQPSDTLLKEFARRGAKVLSAFPQYRSYRIDIALDQLEAIAALTEVIFIQPKQEAFVRRTPGTVLPMGISDWHEFLSPNFVTRAQRVRNALTDALFAPAKGKLVVPISGSAASEGDTTHRANTARTTFGVNGAGVRIGVISDGAANLASSQATGDLPAGVTILPGQVGTGDEGTAMLEIIHDLAPGAQLFFATGFNSLAGFAQNIRDLRTAGCDIIVDDLGYFVETPLQDGQTISVLSTTNGGLLAQAVNDVTASGALYFSAAGNEGNKNDNQSGAWEGDFVDGGTNALLPGGNVHNFGTAVFDTITTSSGGAPGVLYWSDPLGGSSNDYDLFVLNASGSSVITSSTNLQNGTQDPIEIVGSITANRRLVILKKTGAANRFLHLNTNRGRLSINTSGQTHGHSAGVDAYSVAATPASTAFGASPNPTGPFPNPFNSTNKVEIYSSDGPRRILYNANGTPITPGNLSSTGGTLRQKPDITAADGVSVTGVGGFGSPFYGTSAAAPHAAAIAALIKSGNRSLTPAQIRTVLTSTAIDIEAAGIDRDSGAGIVMAFEALQSIGATPSPSIANGGSALTAESCSPGNSAIDPGETVTVNLLLKNEGNANSSNLVATLQSTGGVLTPSAAQNYGAIAAGGSAVSRSFTFTADAALVCGNTLTATLQLQDGATNLGTVTFSFQIGAFASTVTNTYSYTGAAVALPDLNTVEIPITVSDTGIITDVNVRVRLNHTFDGDLDIHVISPDGTLIDLSTGNGSSGANYGSGTTNCAGTFTIFDDSAATSILNGTPPFAGTFIPSGRLAGFNGKSLNGVWKLRIIDEGLGDTGTLFCWQLEIAHQTFTCCTGAPACPTVTNVAPASGFAGNNVTITGTNFTGVTSVKFSNSVNALFTINSATQITATVPAGAVNGPITIGKLGCPDVTTSTFNLLTCPTISLLPLTLLNGTTGTAYNQTITASGGVTTYAFTVTAGSLPNGLSLTTGGALTGTPTAFGTFAFTVTATDANLCTGAQAYSITINAPPTINAVAVTRQQGSLVSNSTIANVSDANQTANTLAVTVNGGASATVNGVTVSGISTNAAGIVTADVIAACTATNASFTLTVTDAAWATATATLNVTVAGNTAPALTYANASVAAGGATTINPATGQPTMVRSAPSPCKAREPTPAQSASTI